MLLVIIFSLKLCNFYLTGTLGYWLCMPYYYYYYHHHHHHYHDYWLCMLLLGENLLWCSINGSQINLLSITVERYLKVVHHSWSKKVLRKWVKVAAAAFAWISCTVYDMTLNGLLYYDNY